MNKTQALNELVQEWEYMAKGTTQFDAALRVAALKVREVLAKHPEEQPSGAVEIGYLCRKGHFIFHDDPDVDGACGSKRMAGIFVVPEEGVYPVMFAEALAEAMANFGEELGRMYGGREDS